MIARRKIVDRYDIEIECSADYRPKWKVNLRKMWEDLAMTNKVTADNAYYNEEIIIVSVRDSMDNWAKVNYLHEVWSSGIKKDDLRNLCRG